MLHATGRERVNKGVSEETMLCTVLSMYLESSKLTCSTFGETFGEFCEPELFELKYTKTITPSHKLFPEVNHIGAQNKSHDKSQNMMKLLTQSKLKRKVLDNRSNTRVLPEKFWGPPRKEYTTTKERISVTSKNPAGMSLNV